MNPDNDTLTIAEFQRKAVKSDRLTGNVAGLLRSADLSGWVATLNLQLKHELVGTAFDSDIARTAVREALYHLTTIAARLGVPLQDVAGEALEVHHGG